MGLTDSITFTCSACGHSAEYPLAQEGKAIYCPKCQAAQVVRAPGSTTDRFKPERIPTGRIVKADEKPTTDRIEKPHGMAGTARIDFTCGACNHLSRISAALSGQPVRCPTCGTVQLAGVAGLRVVRLDGNSKLPFTCTACNYQARLSPDYSGKAIRCPKCQGAQVVPRILRDPSGTFQALPSGAAVVRSEPGTGQVRKTPTGSFTKDGATAAVPRSDPSAALRTPAGGIPVASPMPSPTPLPGSFSTPPPGSLGTPMRTPLPTAMQDAAHSPSAPDLPPVPLDEDALDLGDKPVEPARPKGGVVRRSGRMAAQTTPLPSATPAEPTLEPARAVRPEPEDETMPQAPPERPARPAPVRPMAPERAAPLPAPAAASRPAPAGPTWLVPVLGVAAVVGMITSIVLVIMLSTTSGTLKSAEQQRDDSQGQLKTAKGEIETLKGTISDGDSARTLIITDRDEIKVTLESLRREHETLKAELERVKAEAAAQVKPVATKPEIPAPVKPVATKPEIPAPAKPAVKASAPTPAGDPGKK